MIYAHRTANFLDEGIILFPDNLQICLRYWVICGSGNLVHVQAPKSSHLSRDVFVLGGELYL